MSLTAAELKAVYSVDESDLDKSIKGIPGKIKASAAMLAGAGLAIGGALAGGLMTGMDNERVNDKLAAQLGAPADYAADLGKIAGDLYANAYGDSLASVDDALKNVLQNGLLPEDATNKQIEAITAKVMNLSETFDQDLGGTTRAVAQMIRTGLAKDGNEALDILTRGFQQGDDKAGDLLDTMNEYGTQFRKLGIDGTTATGLISQGLKAGARDSDLVADAIKEFSIRAVDGSTLTAQSFKGIGLSAQDMSEKIARGGPEAQAALAQVLNGLRGVEDPAKRAQLAVGLFGTQAEDMGAALYALDPSSAVAAMGNVAGAADRMGKTLNDNASTNIESFKRKAMTAFVNVLGGQVLPVVSSIASSLVSNFGPAVSALGGVLSGTLLPAAKAVFGFLSDHQTTVEVIAAVIGAVLVPALILWGVQSTIAAGKSVVSWLTAAVAAQTSAATQELSCAQVVIGWIAMGVQSLIQGAKMAAAWVLAMGPVGWVIATVVALVALIIANWDTVVSWTKTAWSAVTSALGAAWTWIKGAASAALNFLVNLFLNFTGPGLIIKHWQSIVNFTRSAWAAVTGAVSGAWNAVVGAVSGGVSRVVSFVRGLPGKIMGAVGNLGSLLVNAGRNLLEGLWNGISGAASWLKNKVMSWAGSILPGWVKSILGIHSPSTVFAEIGRYLMLGMGAGIDAEAKTAVNAAARAAAAITDAMQVTAPDLSAMANAQALAGLTARRPAGALSAPAATAATASAVAGTGGPLVNIEEYYEQPGSSPAANAQALAVEVRTRPWT